MHERQVFQAIEQLRFLYERGHLTAVLFESKKRELMAQLEMTPVSFLPPEGQTQEGQRTPLQTSKLITRDFSSPSRVPKEHLHQLLDEDTAQRVLGPKPARVEHEPTTSEDLGEIRQLQVGDLVRGRYRLEKLLGSGGMGQVFLAEDLRFAGTYALKILHPWVVKHEPTISRFIQEFKIMEKLNHPGIVRTYLLDEDTAHESLFFLMEYVKGETLQHVLDHALATKGVPPFTAEETLHFLEKLTLILRYTHSKRILHRDLKPTNIMLMREKEDISLKLLDFGLAKHLTEASNQALHTGQAGTFFYIAPEQLLGGETATVAADIFSIGVILYQMLTGSLPVAMAAPPSELNSSLPKEADHVLRRAMDVHWQKRYQHTDELYEAFAQTFRSSSLPNPSMSNSAPTTHPPVVGPMASSGERTSSGASLSGEKSNPPGSTDRFHFSAPPTPAPPRPNAPSRTAPSSSPASSGPTSRGSGTPTSSHPTSIANKDTIGRPAGSSAISNADRIARLRSGPQPRKSEPSSPTSSAKTPYLHAFPAHDRKIVRLALNPDGSFLASLSQDHTVKLWESSSWFPLHTLQPSRNGLLHLLWRNKGSQLVFLDRSGQIELWDVLRLEAQSRLQIPSPPHTMAMAPEERFLYIGCEDGTLQIWDLEHQRHEKTLPGHTGPLCFLQYCHEHQQIVSCDMGGLLIVRDTRNVTRFSQLQQTGSRITACSVSPKKPIAVLGADDGALFVWDLQQRRQLRTWMGHQRTVTNLEWSPHGNWLVSTSLDGSIKLWRPEEADPLCNWVDPQGGIYTTAVAKNGKWLASAGQDHMIKIWDTSIWGL